MAYSDGQLSQIWDRGNGRCHGCGKRLTFRNYGRAFERGAWEVDHSVARARGGTDHGNNLRPACIACNRSKGAMTSRALRARNGRTRAPLSKEGVRRAKRQNAVVGAGIGAAVGGVLGGPPGAWLGAGVGALFGRRIRPD